MGPGLARSLLLFSSCGRFRVHPPGAAVSFPQYGTLSWFQEVSHGVSGKVHLLFQSV